MRHRRFAGAKQPGRIGFLRKGVGPQHPLAIFTGQTLHQCVGGGCNRRVGGIKQRQPCGCDPRQRLRLEPLFRGVFRSLWR